MIKKKVKRKRKRKLKDNRSPVIDYLRIGIIPGRVRIPSIQV